MTNCVFFSSRNTAAWACLTAITYAPCLGADVVAQAHHFGPGAVPLRRKPLTPSARLRRHLEPSRAVWTLLPYPLEYVRTMPQGFSGSKQPVPWPQEAVDDFDALVCLYAVADPRETGQAQDQDTRTLVEARPDGWWYTALVGVTLLPRCLERLLEGVARSHYRRAVAYKATHRPAYFLAIGVRLIERMWEGWYRGRRRASKQTALEQWHRFP
jgi:hypothetical protein